MLTTATRVFTFVDRREGDREWILSFGNFNLLLGFESTYPVSKAIIKHNQVCTKIFGYWLVLSLLLNCLYESLLLFLLLLLW